MSSNAIKPAAVLASLGLVACTLAVFGFNQLRGPEGTVHRFMLAISEHNVNQVDRLSYGSARAKTVTASFVDRVFLSGGRYQVVDVSQKKSKARVGVIFYFPRGHQLPWIVSLSRAKDRWLVDADGTAGPGPTFLEGK